MSIKAEVKSEDESSVQEYPTLKNFNLRCGEIFLTSNGYQFNCSNCNDYFMNFEYFADHVQKIHYIVFENSILNSQSNVERQIPEIQDVPPLHPFFDVDQTSNINLSIGPDEQDNNNLLEEVKCNVDISFPNENDIEIIEIGECKYTLKNIPSIEDLNDNSTNIPTIANVQENYMQHTLHMENTQQKQNKRKFEFCCNKVFTNAYEYNIHLSNYHQDSPYQCTDCGKKFLGKEPLTEHMSSIHQLTLRYECKKCELIFTTSESLQYHARSHKNDDSYQCNICNEYFTTRMLLANHFRIHNRPEPTKRNNRHCKCDICGSTLSRKDNFRRHLKNMHRLDNSVIDNIIKKLTSGPRYKINDP